MWSIFFKYNLVHFINKYYTFLISIMDKKIFKKKIQSILGAKKDINNIEWDSLKNLEILMELDKLFPKKINKINKISQINNYLKLEKILLNNKLIN